MTTPAPAQSGTALYCYECAEKYNIVFDPTNSLNPVSYVVVVVVVVTAIDDITTTVVVVAVVIGLDVVVAMSADTTKAVVVVIAEVTATDIATPVVVVAVVTV